MIEHFNKNHRHLSKELSKMGVLGDYIIARRLSRRHFDLNEYGPIKINVRSLLTNSLNWDYTPQGSSFWHTIFDKTFLV